MYLPETSGFALAVFCVHAVAEITVGSIVISTVLTPIFFHISDETVIGSVIIVGFTTALTGEGMVTPAPFTPRIVANCEPVILTCTNIVATIT
jgi:hypothetical protein